MAETITIKNVYDELKKIEETMATKQELEEYLESFGILSNQETMESIKRSREDIKNRRVRKITSVADMLNEI
jgi:hypothetical protein